MAVLLLALFQVQSYLDYRQIRSGVLGELRTQAETIREILFSAEANGIPTQGIQAVPLGLPVWQEANVTIRQVSVSPTNPEHQADAQERRAIHFFQDNPEARERLVSIEPQGGEAFFHYAIPMGLTASPEIQGQERGSILSIQLPVRAIRSRVMATWQPSLLVHGTLFLLVFAALSRLLERTVLSPIGRLKQAAAEITEGNYGAAAELAGYEALQDAGLGFERMAEVIGQREKALNRQKGLYAVLSHTNKTIIRDVAPAVLYARFCEIAVTYGGFTAAWIGDVDLSHRLIRPLAHASIEGDDFVDTILPLQADNPLGMAVLGRCPAIIDEIDWEAGNVSWQLATAKAGRSVAVLPIIVKQQVSALLMVFAEEAYYFDEPIRELLDEVVTDLAFAVENHARNQAHLAVHKALEASSARLSDLNRQMSLLLESTGEGIFGVDLQGCCRFVNQAAASMLGYHQAELLNKPLHEMIRLSGGVQQAFCEGMTAESGARRVKDESFRRQDDTQFPVEYATYPILEEGRLQGSVTVFRDVTESRSMLRELRFLASHDPLTHLLNRHAFDQRLREAVADARDHGHEHVMFYMDLDQFKVMNDTCGHVAGDTMLRHLSHHLRQAIGAQGVLARLGGDEFGLLLECCSLDEGLRVAEDIFDTVRRFRFPWEGRSFSCGMSIGVATIGPATESARTVLSAADTACYVAKDMGRNRVHVYRPYDEEITRQQGQMQWVNRIESAIAQNRFSLVQQPILSLASHAIGDEHVEVLLRMSDEAGNEIAPGAFIPAAERYNLMGNIDRWVIGNTFSWFSQHRERLAELGLCAINLSGQSFGDSGLPEYILEQLRRYDLPAEKFSFEITETAVVSRLDQATRFISLLKRKGFHFALDDFGTGMSSFAYLRSLPVDYLKIDGSFVRNMLNDPVDRVVVESINQIGHMMGLQTIAEYVESEQIMEQLIEIGVDYAQGFGIERPSPLSAMGEGGRLASR